LTTKTTDDSEGHCSGYEEFSFLGIMPFSLPKVNCETVGFQCTKMPLYPRRENYSQIFNPKRETASELY
jgi:hypothetical protein